MLGRLRDAVADVRDAGSNATSWLGIDELAQAAAYAGSGNEVERRRRAESRGRGAPSWSATPRPWNAR